MCRLTGQVSQRTVKTISCRRRRSLGRWAENSQQPRPAALTVVPSNGRRFELFQLSNILYGDTILAGLIFERELQLWDFIAQTALSNRCANTAEPKITQIDTQDSCAQLRDGLEFVFSRDIIPSGWLGSKHQLIILRVSLPIQIIELVCKPSIVLYKIITTSVN